MTERFNHSSGEFNPGIEPVVFTPTDALHRALARPVELQAVAPQEPFVAAGLYDPKTFKPNSAIGQHVLLDHDVLRATSELIPTGANVIEIGAGPGTLTSNLLARDAHVTAYEIDERCEPMLTHLSEETGRLDVRWQDFTKATKEELEGGKPYHIAGNIPFQISEPLLWKMADLDFESAVLLLGDRLVKNMVATNPDPATWNRLSLVTRAYFDVEKVVEVPRDSFDPPPRVDAGVVRLTRKDKDPNWRSDAVTRSYRAIVESTASNSTIAKALKTVVVKPNGDAETRAPHRSGNRRTERRVGRAALKELASDFNAGYQRADRGQSQTAEEMFAIVSKTVDERILNKPLNGLSNSELAKVCGAISSAVNKRKKRR